MKFWITTDTHFGHKQMVEYCGRPGDFERRIFNGLRQIPHDDVLIHLGDVCIGQDEANHAKWIRTLPCRKWLVKGNHDRKSHHWYLTHGWDYVSYVEGIVMYMEGKRVYLTHAPLMMNIKEGDYTVNVHGHFHNTDHRKHEPQYNDVLGPYHRLVALENTNYQPVPLSRLISDKYEVPETA